MNIGLSTSVIQRGKSGVGQYVFALVKALLRENRSHRLTLFVLEEDLPLFEFAACEATIVPVPERFRPPVKNILWHQTTLPRLAREHQLDVLHVPSYRRMLWRQPCALVTTIHDLAPFRVKGKYDWKRMLYGRVVARRLAQRQDKIVAVSENTRRDVSEFFKVPDERLSVVLNGIDHKRFTPDCAAEERSFVEKQYDLCQPFFLYIARLEHPAKNHVRLIEAFNQFKAETKSDWQLVFGGSDWHGAPEIHAAIARSPATRDIRCLGFVDDAAVPMLYRAASVFVFPSLFEGFGLPPLEAMACGCPVLCSTRGSLGEIVGSAAAIMDPENITGMKSQLARLAADPDWRARLSAAGLNHARHFDWQRAASQTLDVYEAAHRERNVAARPDAEANPFDVRAGGRS